MKMIHTALIAAALTIAAAGAAIAATPDGQIHRQRDPFTHGGRAAAHDIYSGSARFDKHDVFSHTARVTQPRDVFTDGARGI